MQLSFQFGVTYKTAWYMLKRIRAAIGQRDGKYLLDGTIEFDDTYLGTPTKGGKRGQGMEKAKVFVALSLREAGSPLYLKITITPNIKQTSVSKFAQSAFMSGSTVRSDGYHNYIPALQVYNHEHRSYDPNSNLLHWPRTVVGNVKAFILGTYHGLSKANLQAYLDEFCFRFNRRFLAGFLWQCLAFAVGASRRLN